MNYYTACKNTPRTSVDKDPCLSIVASQIGKFKQYILNWLNVSNAQSIKYPASKKILDLSERITVGAYNILFPQPEIPNEFSTKMGYDVQNGKPYNNIKFRLNLIDKNIRDAHLDVVCLQEVVQETFETLKKSFENEYESTWQPHSIHSNGKKSHGVAIFYKTHKFTKKNEDFLKIQIPIPDSRQQSQVYIKPRVQISVDLQDKTTKKIFRVVSCHLCDPREFSDKTIHSRQVVDFAEKPSVDYDIDRTVIAGDMNQNQYGDYGTPFPPSPGLHWASAFKPFFNANYHTDENYDLSTRMRGREGFDAESATFIKKGRIDYIWSKYFQPYPQPMTQDFRASDHPLVASTII